MANSKAEVDKKYIDKTGVVPIGLSKLFNVVDNHVIKKTVYDQLVWKVHAIDSSKLIKKWTVIQKLIKIEDTIPNHDKYITTPEFNNFTKKKFRRKAKTNRFSELRWYW